MWARPGYRLSTIDVVTASDPELTLQVSRKLSEIKETLSSSSSSAALGLKLKQFNILNENRQIDPVDISINLCDLEL